MPLFYGIHEPAHLRDDQTIGVFYIKDAERLRKVNETFNIHLSTDSIGNLVRLYETTSPSIRHGGERTRQYHLSTMEDQDA